VSEIETAVRLRYYAGLYHFQLARAYLATRREQAAIIAMSRAILFSPVLLDAALWDDPAWARLRTSVLETAVHTAEAQLSTRSLSAEMTYRLARLLIALGRLQDARTLLQDALRLAATPDADQQPGLPRRITYALGLIEARSGHAESALSWWDKALKLDPTDAATMWQVGRLLVARGDVARGDVARGDAARGDAARGDSERGDNLLQTALRRWQQLDPSLTAADLRDDHAWQAHHWTHIAERQAAWFNEAFQRPAPPFLGFAVSLRADALCFAGEWNPWLHMPKLRAAAIDRSLLAPAGT
jgi:tetratricopeptide (TPR) repeat protein